MDELTGHPRDLDGARIQFPLWNGGLPSYPRLYAPFAGLLHLAVIAFAFALLAARARVWTAMQEGASWRLTRQVDEAGRQQSSAISA